jgi:hypothetical protein
MSEKQIRAIYKRYYIISVVFVVVYLFVFLLLPVTISDSNIPTLGNGITTSISIIVGFGGAVTGIIFRGDIEKGDSKGALGNWLRIHQRPRWHLSVSQEEMRTSPQFSYLCEFLI